MHIPKIPASVWNSLKHYPEYLAAITNSLKLAGRLWTWLPLLPTGAVLSLMRENDRRARLTKNPVPVYPSALSPFQIATAVKRNPKRVERALRKLESQGKVKEFRTGWIIPDGKPEWIYR